MLRFNPGLLPIGDAMMTVFLKKSMANQQAHSNLSRYGMNLIISQQAAGN